MYIYVIFATICLYYNSIYTTTIKIKQSEVSYTFNNSGTIGPTLNLKISRRFTLKNLNIQRYIKRINWFELPDQLVRNE